ncbi:MAG: undecaprenyl-diphosphate phosphatase [Longimicrobiales bacterium]
MSHLEALILGIIQGATEFLPVSSSGHLVMGQALMDIRIPGVAFEVALHVATLISVLLVYRNRVRALLAGAFRGDREAWRYGGLLVLATLPAAVVGVGLGGLIEGLFDSPAVAGGALLVTGSFLWTSRKALEKAPSGRPGALAALVMGLAQAFAIIPGISRSGATVVAGLWSGVEAEEAAAFSFLMAVPAILGAAVLEAPELANAGMEIGFQVLLLGALAAAVTGVLAIWTFVAMLRRRSFHRFGPYCWGVGVLFLLYLTLGG